MFGFLSSKLLRSEVEVLVEAFARVCPPPSKIRNKRIKEQEVSSSLDELFRHVAAYSRDRRLGILGRARLAKALQDEMRRREYPDDLVSRVVNAVTVNVLVAPGRD